MTPLTASAADPAAPAGPPRLRTCASCAGPLPTQDRRTIFCSDRCRTSGATVRACTDCGTPIAPGDGRVRRCDVCRGDQLPASRAEPDLATLAGREALSPAETALVLGISSMTLFTSWREGEGPPSFRLRGRRLVSVTALREWMAQRSSGAGSGS